MAPIPAAIAALLTGLASGGAKVAGTIAQNNYNSPISQLRRIRKAGLPFAAMGNNIANTQSEPIGDLGISQAGAILQQFTQSQKTDQEIENLQADVNRILAITEGQQQQNKRYGAENRFLLDGLYDDSPIHRNLRAMQRSLLATAEGQEVSNKIQSFVERTQEQRFGMEMAKQGTDLANAMKQGNYLDEQIGIAEAEKRIRDAEADIAKAKNAAELREILTRIGVMKEGIETSNIQQDLMSIDRNVRRATWQNDITQSDYKTIIAGIQTDEVKRQFKNLSDYQKFVDSMRSYLNKENPSNWESVKAYIDFIYTKLAGPNGQGMDLRNIFPF